MKKRLFAIMAIFVLAYLPAYAGPVQDTTNALTALKNHILGTPTLSGTQIAANKATIDTNQALFGTDSSVITAGFSFIDTYDTQIGALWLLGSPIQSIDRNTITDSDIEWSVWNVMQYIMDYTYTASNVGAFETDLNGKLFGSSADFPGSVDPAAQRTNNYSVDINADYPDTVGWPRFMEGPGNFSRKPTGTYAAPGDIVEVTVPASMVNQGYTIRVGCHSWDFETSNAGTPKNPIKRLDRVSLVYDITSATTKVANPLGGGIYIEVPFDTAGSVETIQITNAVRSPFFSVNSITGNNTTVSDWQTTERTHPAPWADFQSEKFMMNVPTDWIYALDRPDELMADWDTAMDIYNDMMGFPRIQGRESSYYQVDVSIRGGAYYPGWPQCNVSYNPDTDYGGLSSNYLISGPRFAKINIPCHEDGHGYLFPKFPGEVESTVNLGCVPILNLGFGYDLDYAFAASLNQQGNPYRTLDHTAMVWMTSFNFVNDAEMGEKEKKYQLPGHAKFVDIARIFGWQVLNDYFKSFVDYYEATGIAKPFDNDTDEHILRLCIAADCDLTPLLYFWGIHPDDPATLAADIAAANLTDATVDKSKIYHEIVEFSTLVPADNAEFQLFASSWWDRVPQLDATDQAEREHAQQWDTYDESSHDAIIAQINNILTMCFPGDGAVCLSPFDGQEGVSTTTDLEWSMGTDAVDYDVYLGTDYDAVLNATTGSPEYQDTVSGTIYTPTLEPAKFYYWRVDTNTSGGTIPGNVCSFLTGNLVVLVNACDFESGFGNWVNVSDDPNWLKLHSGPTPTALTGPSGGADGSPWYAYMETTPGEGASNAGDTVILESPDLDADAYSMRLDFHYHMYGEDIGTLNVDVYDGTWHEGVWSITGQQQGSSEAAYEIAQLDLSSYSGTIKVRFRAVAAGGWRGDIAIDNITITGMAITQLISECDFESGFGDWVNVGYDDYDWTRHTEGTQTPNTGPSGGADGSTWYAYMETSSPEGASEAGDTVILESPDLDADAYSMRLDFDYHMFGEGIGTLNVDVYDGTWHEAVWSISEQQQGSSEAAYENAQLDLSSYSGTIKVRFRAVATGDWRGDIAIDNISITGTAPPPSLEFVSDPIILSDGLEGRSYTDTLAGSATDPIGGTVTYSITSDPSWLITDPNGALSGIPHDPDVGLNEFTVRATGINENYAEATLQINVLNRFMGENGLVDFAGFAANWLDINCGICNGADLDDDNDVGPADLNILAQNWLAD